MGTRYELLVRSKEKKGSLGRTDAVAKKKDFERLFNVGTCGFL